MVLSQAVFSDNVDVVLRAPVSSFGVACLLNLHGLLARLGNLLCRGQSLLLLEEELRVKIKDLQGSSKSRLKKTEDIWKVSKHPSALSIHIYQPSAYRSRNDSSACPEYMTE